MTPYWSWWNIASWLNYLSKSEIRKLHNVAPDPKMSEAFCVLMRQQDLLRQTLDLTFNCGVVAIGLIRYLVEHVESLPLSVINCLLNTHDVIVALVPLGD